jgi:prolyl-tRNA synthetase
MTHGDDQGVILPPKLAPVQVAIVPITRSGGDNEEVLDAAEAMRDSLAKAGYRVVLDDRDQYRPGWKFAQYEVEGVPVRLAVGPRDVKNGTAEMARRDTGEKASVSAREIVPAVREALHDVQQALYDRAYAFRRDHTRVAESYDAFKAQIEEGGFVLMHWDGTAETEARVKDETKATIRCVPFPDQFPGIDTEAAGTDPVSGRPSERLVVYARAY